MYSSGFKMLLAVLLLIITIFSDIQARFTNERRHPSFLVASSSTGSNTKNLCAGISVNECESQHPQEIKQCKVCGLISSRDFHPMIINGNVVDPPFKYPWMVYLTIDDGRICGAAIISDSYVLTAAHCVIAESGDFPSLSGKEAYVRPNEVSVRFVAYFPLGEPGPPVEKVIPHPEFSMETLRYDVALLQLKEKITCGKYRNPICLPSPDLNINMDTVLHTTGWGTTVGEKPHDYPWFLMEGTARLVNFSECKERIKLNLEDISYCLLGREFSSACSGDSGGPMFYLHKKKYYAMGVVSAHTCTKCSTNKPVIYVAIPKVVRWIEKIAGPRIKP